MQCETFRSVPKIQDKTVLDLSVFATKLLGFCMILFGFDRLKLMRWLLLPYSPNPLLTMFVLSPKLLRSPQMGLGAVGVKGPPHSSQPAHRQNGLLRFMHHFCILGSQSESPIAYANQNRFSAYRSLADRVESFLLTHRAERGLVSLMISLLMRSRAWNLQCALALTIECRECRAPRVP